MKDDDSVEKKVAEKVALLVATTDVTRVAATAGKWAA